MLYNINAEKSGRLIMKVIKISKKETRRRKSIAETAPRMTVGPICNLLTDDELRELVKKLNKLRNQ